MLRNSFCALLLAVFSFLSASAQAAWIAYTPGSDFGFGTFGTGGDAIAEVSYIPNFGQLDVDFASFTAGNIAVIDRGEIEFGLKAVNAQAHGAVGLIVLDAPPLNSSRNMGGGAVGHLVTIPTVRISQTLGDVLRDELLAPHSPNLFHVRVIFPIDPNGVPNPFDADTQLERFIPDLTSVPEPGTLSLAAIGLVGFAGKARRQRRVAA